MYLSDKGKTIDPKSMNLKNAHWIWLPVNGWEAAPDSDKKQ
jgi:hypothetical protein